MPNMLEEIEDTSRPIPDAAEAVRCAAELAFRMLEEIHQAWWWRMITLPNGPED